MGTVVPVYTAVRGLEQMVTNMSDHLDSPIAPSDDDYLDDLSKKCAEAILVLTHVVQLGLRRMHRWRNMMQDLWWRIRRRDDDALLRQLGIETSDRGAGRLSP
jgi:hypothetical protein